MGAGGALAPPPPAPPCTVPVMHHSVPVSPMHPSLDITCSTILHWMANSWGGENLTCQMPRDRDDKRGQIPGPNQHCISFSLVTQLSSATPTVSIVMCELLFELASALVIELF